MSSLHIVKGIEVVDGPSQWFNGRFAWFLNLNGHKLELWEPAKGFWANKNSS